MPLISYGDNSPEGKKRQELIKKILPTEPIVSSFLQPRLMEATHDILIKALRQEIEIYKQYPKKGEYSPVTFDTRNPTTCFMGQGFRMNSAGMEGWTDAELAEYRKRIGTLSHQEWGDCTLMEIWGGDHFEVYKEMVVGVFEYAWGKRKTMPDLHFYINPLFKNIHSGKTILNEVQIEQGKEAAHMTKIAAYLEIKDRLKKANQTNVLNLGLTEADDPPPSKYKRRYRDEDDDDEDDE